MPELIMPTQKVGIVIICLVRDLRVCVRSSHNCLRILWKEHFCNQHILCIYIHHSLGKAFLHFYTCSYQKKYLNWGWGWGWGLV